jgi:glycosyltransferase involved in cell wall biosynthesis
MLRVALDATSLLGNPTGIGRAVAGALGGLAVRDDLDVSAYALSWRGRGTLGAVVPAGVAVTSRPMAAGLLLRTWQRWPFPPVEWWTGPADVVHGTNFVAPPARRAAQVVSVWDLTAVRYPQWCTPSSRRYPALVRAALSRGAFVHTASRSVAEEVIELLGAPAERVRVVAPGIPDISASGPPPDRGTRRYVLALGTVEPRKDLPGLVTAFATVAPRHPDVDLRIVGPAGWGEDALAAAIAASAVRDRIERTGWVADTGPLLAGAAALAYPSRYEGFGFPPLEAMKAGVPVVATSAGSLPEVLGDAALLVPVGEPQALADALGRVLGQPAVAARLVAAGHERVARYSWVDMAGGLAALYGDAFAEKS